ncbi:TOMM precursor leader peptide-binding protein [candidate division KSB1 bacterium]|nr:TOMM precursor leader peptide-binding protein [candidate division KSB1 bacterium]
MIKEIYQVFEDQKHGIYQIRCKDDFFTVEFYDQEEKDIFLASVHQLQDEKRDIDEILHELYEQHPKEKVNAVIEELRQLDLLVEDDLRDRFADHLTEQLNFWDYSKSPKSPPAFQMQERVQNTILAIVGNKFRIDLIAQKAKMCGFENISTVEITSSEDQILAHIEKSDFSIVDSNEWNPGVLEQINQLAVTKNIPWLFIQGCNALSASIGPLFTGRHNGCYHCLMTRMKSNMEFVPHFEEFEKYLRNGKRSSTSCGAPIPLYDLIASISVLETLKYVTEWSVPSLYKTFITIDYFSLTITHHKLLKVPTCPVCEPAQDFLQAPWLEPVTLT